MIISLIHRRIRSRYHRLGLTSRFLKLADCELHYYESANPPTDRTMVLLHGLGTSSSTWIHLLPFFLTRIRVLALDLPGFGFSRLSGPQTHFTLEEHSRVVAHWIANTTAEPITLVGHSLGGWLAARYAARHPERILRLVLINTAGVFYDGAERQARSFHVQGIGDVRRLMNKLWYRYPWTFKLFLPAIKNDLKRRHVSDLISSVQEEDFLNAELQKLRMPVVLIWGKEDGLIASETIDILAKSIPHLVVRTIEKCGHVPQLERPEKLLELFSEIFSEGSESRGTRGIENKGIQ